MLRQSASVSRLKAFLAAALFAYSCGAIAQRGAGGASTGGGLADGGGLGSVGRSTGVDVKDDLKDFHAALAVQATSQQITAYSSMVKSTSAASAELHAFLEYLAQQNAHDELAGRATTLDQAIEKARSDNKKFLDTFSEQQKSGLREIIKKLLKDDSDLTQQARDLAGKITDANAGGALVALSAQALDRTLTTFRSRQIDLGEEMSIGVNTGQDSTFNLPPMKNSIAFANQSIAITTSGVISRDKAHNGENVFALELVENLSLLQQNMTDVLRAQLDRADRCGERMEVHNAALTPLSPASLAVVQLHYERWTCFARETEVVEADGTVEVKLIPSVAEDGTLRIATETGRVDAQGLFGELVRSGSPGEALREKIAETVLSTLRQGSDFHFVLPSAAQGHATLRHVQFESFGAGGLVVVLSGEIRVSAEQAASLIRELKERASSSQTTQQAATR